MAEKGIHRSRGPKLEPDDATTEKGKRSLGEKLMDKLHPTFKSTH